jgi:hypothetical protein
VRACGRGRELAIGKPRKIAEFLKEAEKEVDIDPHLEDRIKWEKEKAEKRRIWEEDFARRKEAERLILAREELAREKKHRLDSWMNNGGDSSDFERAWPSMMQAIMEERYRSRQERAEDLFA